MSELRASIVTTYSIATLTFINSMVMVNIYGLDVRGELAAYTLYAALFAGLGTAFYEGGSQSGSARTLSVGWLAVGLGIAILLLELFVRSQALSISLVLGALVMIEFATGVTIIRLITHSIRFYNIVRLSHPLMFLVLNLAFTKITFSFNTLFISYLAAAAGSLSLAVYLHRCSRTVGFDAIELTGLGEETTQSPTPGSILHISRPIFQQVDKVLLERLLSPAAFGAYVTITSLVNLGGPVLNAIQQLSFHRVIGFMSTAGFARIWAISLMLGVVLCPVIDYLFFGQRLKDYLIFIPLIALLSFCANLSKHAENKLIHQGNAEVLMALKIALLIGVTIAYYYYEAAMLKVVSVLLILYALYALVAVRTAAGANLSGVKI
ncbi:hypothetical protein N9X77_06530 [Luminiphilus sp.]|nr:hypothetical protein [Luminiphilus sp.]